MRCRAAPGRTADAGDIVRGIGWGVAIKNLMYSEGFDDYSTARCRLADGVATLKFATSEVGQGFVTIAGQIARDDPRRRRGRARPRSTPQVGSAGSTSASRQTWMSGGAVDAACRAVRERLFEHVGAAHGARRDCGWRSTAPTSSTSCRVGGCRSPRRPPGLAFDETVEYHHPPTEDLDENGQGNCHTAFAFVAHRAVVDVDPELGLVKVVQVATAQDVGRALNPLSVLGQIEGGIAQGLGLAVMEEIIQIDGRIRNASFTDYLLPTFLDMPDVVIDADRGARSAGPARRQGRRRAAVHLVDAGDRRRHPRRAAPGRRRRQTARPACPSARATSPRARLERSSRVALSPHRSDTV